MHTTYGLQGLVMSIDLSGYTAAVSALPEQDYGGLGKALCGFYDDVDRFCKQACELIQYRLEMTPACHAFLTPLLVGAPGDEVLAAFVLCKAKSLRASLPLPEWMIGELVTRLAEMPTELSPVALTLDREPLAFRCGMDIGPFVAFESHLLGSTEMAFNVRSAVLGDCINRLCRLMKAPTNAPGARVSSKLYQRLPLKARALFHAQEQPIPDYPRKGAPPSHYFHIYCESTELLT